MSTGLDGERIGIAGNWVVVGCRQWEMRNVRPTDRICIELRGERVKVYRRGRGKLWRPVRLGPEAAAEVL